MTGAGRRLGLAMALELGRQGHDVALHYASSSEGAEAGAAEITKLGRRAVALQADLLRDSAAEALVGRAAEALGGPLTCLVNNASIFEFDDLAGATRESWDRHLGSNLRAPFVLIQSFAAQAREPVADAAGEPVAQAQVINMVDQRVLSLTPHFMTYTLAKSALWTLTQTAAMALAPRVRVNAIAPGPTLKGDRQTDAHFASQRRNVILNRGADPEDITRALVYLLGARAVTGQLLTVDGGQHLAWQTPDLGSGASG